MRAKIAQRVNVSQTVSIILNGLKARAKPVKHGRKAMVRVTQAAIPISECYGIVCFVSLNEIAMIF